VSNRFKTSLEHVLWEIVEFRNQFSNIASNILRSGIVRFLYIATIWELDSRRLRRGHILT
jgi:hypothetical protein